MKNPITNLLTGYFILQLITVIGWAGADVHAASETNLGERIVQPYSI
ncbi:hypothetical protein ES703_101651 [subsurface metagenome]